VETVVAVQDQHGPIHADDIWPIPGYLAEEVAEVVSVQEDEQDDGVAAGYSHGLASASHNCPGGARRHNMIVVVVKVEMNDAAAAAAMMIHGLARLEQDSQVQAKEERQQQQQEKAQQVLELVQK
jgi:hypothetical protein